MKVPAPATTGSAGGPPALLATPPAPEVLTRVEGAVGVVTINRPKVRNALSLSVMESIVMHLETFDADPAIGAMVLTGDERAFAAGADIGDMAEASAVDMILRDQFRIWDRLRRIAKPVIAAVSGFALGGGCELALACDLIVCSDTAEFGQPEVGIGVMPGAGGTQRLTRALGKVRAMEMVLSGRTLSARDALAAGLVNRVAPVELHLEQAIALARDIAARARIAVRLAKESVLHAEDATLEAGLLHERKLFYLLFATEDQKEGMKAFREKRKPEWRGR